MLYLLFNQEELENVLSELKNPRPTFKRYRYAEILAETEDSDVVGKYRNTVFVFTTRELNLSVEALEKIEIEIIPDDGSFKPFRFGKYSYTDKILIDTEYRDNLFHDYLPALLSEITTARILIKDCYLRVVQMAKKEAKIVKDVTKLSEEAKTLSSEKLEELSFEVSALRSSFFTSYMHFKDAVEEIFSAISRARSISSFLDGMLAEKINELRSELETISYYESRFVQTLMGIRDALDVVHLRLEMLRGKENLELQKRTSSLQAAAAIIEFVAVFYYTLKIWETFLPIKNMPPSISFTLLAAFTTLVVLYTETLGEYIRERKIGRRFVLLTLLLLLSLLLMASVPNLFSKVL